MSNNLCLVCNRRPKREDHQFCSDKCTKKMALKREPQLLRVPKDHVMYDNGECLHASIQQSMQFPINADELVVKKKFKNNWTDKKENLPIIAKMYLITWPKDMRASFEEYR